MDKEWLHLSRFSEQYRDGAQKFVERARESCKSEMIVCPCVRCRNLMHHHYDTVYEHLVIKGMDPTYTVWVFHGEQPSESNLVDVEIPESIRMFKDFYAQIQQRFKVSDCHQRMTFQYMGKYWRTFKSRLRKEIRSQVKSYVNRTRTITLLRPKNVDSEEDWEKCSKFSNMRTNKKLLYTMGRKGYPRVAHEMRKKNPDLKGLRTRVWTGGHLRKDGRPINEAVADTLRGIEDCSASISDTPAEDSIRKDAVARILGPERHGRVRGLGRVRELETQLQTQAQRMRALEEKVEALLKLSQQSVDDRNSNVITPQSHQGSTVPMTNARCHLLHWYMFEEEEVVAEGKIATTDPSAKVHHLPLGRDCWKVWVEEVYMSNLTLYRLTDECLTLSEAIGSTVAWPKSSIRLL